MGICSGRHEKFDIVAKMMYLGDSSMDLRPESSRGRSRRVLGRHITKLDGVIPPRRGANSNAFSLSRNVWGGRPGKQVMV